MAAAVLAIVLLSSSLVSAIICGATVAAVMLDVALDARSELDEPGSDPTPDKITVDLSRRS